MGDKSSQGSCANSLKEKCIHGYGTHRSLSPALCVCVVKMSGRQEMISRKYASFSSLYPFLNIHEPLF